jgi:predicted metal-dependent phosphoesterase TrpH
MTRVGAADEVDLHCHSNVSDGRLLPFELVRRAAANGVALLALTDHDELGGLAEAAQAAHQIGIDFVPGVEISTTWRGKTVHVVGLGIDPADASLSAGLARLRSGRTRRAESMARSLAAAGVQDSFEGALRHADNAEMIGRTHFARHLVSIGAVSSTSEAFRRYLVPGKPGHVPHEWARVGEAVGWIRAAGGQAVLAHPGRYALSAAALHDLLNEFRAAGGRALEVVTSSHSRDQFHLFGALAQAFGLLASRGSDFHAPGERSEFGALPAFTAPVPGIWDALRR